VQANEEILRIQKEKNESQPNIETEDENKNKSIQILNTTDEIEILKKKILKLEQDNLVFLEYIKIQNEKQIAASKKPNILISLFKFTSPIFFQMAVIAVSITVYSKYVSKK